MSYRRFKGWSTGTWPRFQHSNTPSLHHSGLRPGFTMVEAVMSVLLVGMLMVAAMNTLGATATAQYKNAERSRAVLLAEDLMSEILGQNYEEPVDTIQFGRESGESGGDRTNWDDVDDYDGLSHSPPEYPDGTDMPDLGTWERKVEVKWVNPFDLSSISGSETGVKQIVVVVEHNAAPVFLLTAFRSNLPDS